MRETRKKDIKKLKIEESKIDVFCEESTSFF